MIEILLGLILIIAIATFIKLSINIQKDSNSSYLKINESVIRFQTSLDKIEKSTLEQLSKNREELNNSLKGNRE